MFGDLIGKDAGGAGDNDLRIDHAGDQQMVEAGGGRLNPLETSLADDAVPIDGDFWMAAEQVAIEEFLSDVLLAGVEDLGLRGGGLNLGDVLRLDRIAKGNAHFEGRNEWR